MTYVLDVPGWVPPSVNVLLKSGRRKQDALKWRAAGAVAGAARAMRDAD